MLGSSFIGTCQASGVRGRPPDRRTWTRSGPISVRSTAWRRSGLRNMVGTIVLLSLLLRMLRGISTQMQVVEVAPSTPPPNTYLTTPSDFAEESKDEELIKGSCMISGADRRADLDKFSCCRNSTTAASWLLPHVKFKSQVLE